MTTTFLIAVSNGQARFPDQTCENCGMRHTPQAVDEAIDKYFWEMDSWKPKECSRPDCSNKATETFMGEVYCEAHLIVMMRMEE